METQRRAAGDIESNPFYNHDNEEEQDNNTNNNNNNNIMNNTSMERKEVGGGMTQDEIDEMYDSVRTNVSNLSETKMKLINNFSNLTRAERIKKSKNGQTSLASNIRKTPRMHPVGPSDAGKGLSATPRGRSSRVKSTGSKRMGKK